MNSQKENSSSLSATLARTLLLFALTFALCRNVGAQSTAQLNGTVSDPSGAAISSARVIVKNMGTGVEWNTQTNSAGLYVLPSLPPGTYQITVSAEGFQKLLLADLKLDVATAVTKDIQMRVGSMTQEVQVTTEAPLIETSSPGVGQVINAKTVQEIPLNGRHFVDLNLLTPGTVTPPANGFLRPRSGARARLPLTQRASGKTPRTGWSTVST